MRIKCHYLLLINPIIWSKPSCPSGKALPSDIVFIGPLTLNSPSNPDLGPWAISPKITNTKSTIDSISLATSIVRNPLLKILNILNSIDKYLKKCSKDTPELTPLNDSLLTLEQTQNQVVEAFLTETTYNGFILEIITVPYSPTVNRVKAVAKNTQGIILLQTPLSFTTTPQVLIEEIKLIIDSNNLKVN